MNVYQDGSYRYPYPYPYHSADDNVNCSDAAAAALLWEEGVGGWMPVYARASVSSGSVTNKSSREIQRSTEPARGGGGGGGVERGC